MFCTLKKKKIYRAYASKYNSNSEKQVILLMIPNGKGGEVKSNRCKAKPKGRRWHYLAVKKLSAFLRGITFKHQGGFYCLNCLHSFTTKNKLESHKNLCEYKKFSRDGFFFFFYFYFFSSLGWKMQGSISGNTRKALFWENIRYF